ncbi:hypothetical protein R6Q59_011832 [Mikania micrantha]
MAAVAPSADQAAGLLKNLSLDSQSKALEVPEPTKKILVDKTGPGNGHNQLLDRSVTPLIPDFMDPTVAYFSNGYIPAYYYGAYDGTTNGWDDYSRYVHPEGVDMSHGVYGDMYHGYGYASYGPYSPAGSLLPTVAHDGQLYGAQHFQYPGSFFQPMTPTSGPYSSALIPLKGENETSGAAGQPSLTVDSTNGAKGTTGSSPVKITPYQKSIFNANGSYRRGSQNGFQDPRYKFDGVYSAIPLLDSSMSSNAQAKNNANITPVTNRNSVATRSQNLPPQFMGLQSPRPMSGVNKTSEYMHQMYANKLCNQYDRGYRSFCGYGANGYTCQSNKVRGRSNGFIVYNNENSDGLNELNRGPRTRSVKNQKVLTPVTLVVKDQNLTLTPSFDVEKETEEKVCPTPNREQYNQPDFPDTYVDAKFFIIKSYSEDDVHKSIKYNVWASTQNGNKKLDAAYQEAQQKPGSCPIFLFFSVNTSGQFVGVAEMVGPVDFNKSLEYWQQDKWIGCFPVKWHIVKDLSNSLLKHITLENNENKPVTNSRDTQEVKLEQGLEVIKIFKEEPFKQCILDDFDFYEDRQRRIQEKKAKQQHFQKQLCEEKPKEGIKVEAVPPKSSEVLQETLKEGIPAEKKITENGVAKGC